MDTVSLLCRGILYVEVILYSKECNWYTRCCPLNGGVLYHLLRETIHINSSSLFTLHAKIISNFDASHINNSLL